MRHTNIFCQVMEFAAGDCVTFGHLFDNDADAASYGRCMGLMHAHDREWYDSQFEFKDTGIILLDPDNQRDSQELKDLVATYEATKQRYGDLKLYFATNLRMMCPGFRGIAAREGCPVWAMQTFGMFPSNSQLDMVVG